MPEKYEMIRSLTIVSDSNLNSREASYCKLLILSCLKFDQLLFIGLMSVN